MQGLLTGIRELTDYFIFQQDRPSAPAHRVRETVELLQTEARNFIPYTLWPPNSPDLNPVQYKIWIVMQEEVYIAVEIEYVMSTNCVVEFRRLNLGQSGSTHY